MATPPIIQFKRGSFVNLPDLLPGEPAYTTDLHDLYVGTSGIGTATNQFFGSGRYWERETASTATKLKLFESTGGGTNSLSFQAPNNLSGIGTFIFPDTSDGSPGDALLITGINNGVYTLEWANATAGAVSGITLRDDGAPAPPEGVSGIGSVTTVDVVGAGVTAEFDNTTVTGVGTIRVYTATTTQEGTARFSSDDFTVSSGLVELASDITFTDATFTTVNVTDTSTLNDVSVGSALTVAGATDLNGGLDVSGGETVLSSATVSDLTQNRVVYAGASGSLIDSTNLTFNGTSFTVGTGVGITQFSNDDTLGGSSSTTVPTENAVKTYVDAQITAQDLDFSGDSGTSAVDLDSQTFTISGTANEIETSASGQTLTVGLPNTVVVTTELEVPTLEVATIQHTNNTTALTIDTSGNVTAAQNFTITGNLFVNGTTTQVNTTSLTVEDSLIELGVVNGSAPASDLNVDLGFIMNWYDSQLRKASVFWDDSAGRIAIAQDVSESSSTLTVNDWAAVEMGEVWMNDIGGQNAVMSYLSSDTLYTGQPAGRYLQSITVDGGEF